MNGEIYDIETFTGTHLTWENFDPGLVRIDDIAHSLAMQCRYNGHCQQFFSVAEHCILVADWMRRQGYGPRLQLLALLHDATETYIGDIVRPVKDEIPAVRVLEARIDTAVWEGLHIPPPTEDEHVIVKIGDDVLLASEAVELMHSGGATWRLAQAPDPAVVICNWCPPQAELKFIERYNALTHEATE